MDPIWSVITQCLVVYLFAAILCFHAFYSDVVGIMGHDRVPRVAYKGNALLAFLTCEKEVMKLLFLDFLRIHCPWSKKTSVKYRVQEAHRLLCRPGITHEKGWTAEDCHDPTKYEQIAKDCFQSRFRFWKENVLMMLTAPFRFAALIVLALVITGAEIVELFRR